MRTSGVGQLLEWRSKDTVFLLFIKLGAFFLVTNTFWAARLLSFLLELDE